MQALTEMLGALTTKSYYGTIPAIIPAQRGYDEE